ncbi:MAG: TIGR01459 family HAD-type hydrolase [Caulobacteraceae bacterium]
MTIRLIAGLAEIADRYDTLLCDVWGVIHNGREAFPGPCAALECWRRERGPVILISNSPRPAAGVAEQMDALGVPRAAWSDLVTSGDVTRDMLAARAPGPAWRIGPDRDAPLYEGLGLAFADLGGAAFILCTGPNDDEVETPEDYRAPLAAGVERGLEMVCANPDKVVQRGDRLIYCAGALADLYQNLGGAVVMAGKPFAPIYEACLARAREHLSRPLDRRRVLAVGDGIPTDLVGANRQGFCALFIASGIHGGDLGRATALDVAAVEALLAQEGASAAFAAPDLAW